jgi:hypothetical protein
VAASRCHVDNVAATDELLRLIGVSCGDYSYFALHGRSRNRTSLLPARVDAGSSIFRLISWKFRAKNQFWMWMMQLR